MLDHSCDRSKHRDNYRRSSASEIVGRQNEKKPATGRAFIMSGLRSLPLITEAEERTNAIAGQWHYTKDACGETERKTATGVTP